MTDLKELIEREIDQYLEWPTADKSHVTTVSAKLFAGHVARLYADHITGAGKMAAPAVQGGPTDAELLDWAGEEQFFLFCDKDDFLDIARSVLQRYVGRSPAVRGEPVAYFFRDEVGRTKIVLGKETAEHWCPPDESITPLYASPQPTEQQPPADGSLTPVPDELFAAEFSAWWKQHGQFCRAGGGDYERTFAFEAWRHLYPRLMSLQKLVAEQQPAPDVAGLVEALEEIAQSCDSGRHDGLPEDGPALSDVEAWLVANDALAAHRKQQEGEP